jgi:hypothetical protein
MRDYDSLFFYGGLGFCAFIIFVCILVFLFPHKTSIDARLDLNRDGKVTLTDWVMANDLANEIRAELEK